MKLRAPSRSAVVPLVLLLWVGGAASADEVDDLLSGFDEPAFEEPDPTGSDGSAQRAWQVGGQVSLDSAFNYHENRSEYKGLAQLRAELRLQLDADLGSLLASLPLALPGWKLRVGGRGWYDAAYRIRGRDNFRGSVLRVYEDEAEVWESYLGGPIGASVDVRGGRLIESFGTSETLRVVDLLFPIDNREPGAADFDDLLLPVAQLRVDASFAGWEGTAVAFLERRFTVSPPEGSSYLLEGQVVPHASKPSDSPQNTEWVAVLRRRVRGVDLSVLGAWFYQDRPSFKVDESSPTGLHRGHQRLWMVGGTAVGALGDFVLRGETAWFDGLSFANDGGRHRRLDVLLGVDWFGFLGIDSAIDVVHRWVPGADPGIERAPDFTRRQQTEWALRVRRTFWRERLALTAVGIAIGADGKDGAILRLQVDFDLTDELQLTAGALLYTSGDLAPTAGLTRNDRLFLGASYRF